MPSHDHIGWRDITLHLGCVIKEIKRAFINQLWKDDELFSL
jgi:hypothetical protein